ncbi:DUF1310 family protein [Bombilactobacillus thymidiniphilus]|uniref:DUF1310 domain-containing protein n=1 Tax=Bombilactobacillus thymidiniphilus TaxID=2923363 RepID=A0ABY4PFH7_9LACO|nr:DUF1310 family protein [Bombilactobacillus thymidiniphilus]UQS84264.1 DUF1310 domain-containing protein [Bombilactobacillus thymidiniphilus]
MLRWIKRYKWWLIISGIVLVIIGLIVGGIHLEEQRQAEFKQEMIKEVKEHNKDILEQLNYDDPHKKVKSLIVDYRTVSHVPMGGIHFDAYINDDESLKFNAILSKDDEEFTVLPAYSNELWNFLTGDK